MLFNSLTFATFFALVALVFWLLRSWSHRKYLLLGASYLFYAAWNPPFIALLAISTCVDWFAAGRMAQEADKKGRRPWLLLSLMSNLGMLAYFKYGGFLVESTGEVSQALGLGWTPPAVDIILPVGISFYTFQTLSYSIDVYRGRKMAPHSFLDFALFVSFFPQLVAGPIVRASDFLPQLVAPPNLSMERVGWGLSLLVVGLFQKVALADGFLAEIVDLSYTHAQTLSPLEAWTGTLAFAGQIYCDFAGYSTGAIGVAMCFGFTLPDNFRYPYGAVGFSDFWRRWHISLSQWLRDYLYISLGGNRNGPSRTQINLMITMLLGGLWHGASWRFVVWGLLHGLYLVAERVIRDATVDYAWAKSPAASWVGWALTFIAVCYAWVFFRANSMADASAIVQAMSGLSSFPGTTLGARHFVTALGLSSVLVAYQVAMQATTLEDVARRLPWPVRAAALAAMMVLILIVPGDRTAFIYFQF